LLLFFFTVLCPALPCPALPAQTKFPGKPELLTELVFLWSGLVWSGVMLRDLLQCCAAL
jgi:hypothetical protein